MARETGYNEDTVKHLVNRMESVHNVIRYNRTTKEVLLLNWWKYNWTESDKLRKGVKASSEVVKSEDFKKYIFSVLDGDIPSEYPMDTVSIPSPYPMHTSVTVTVSDTDTVPASDCSNDFEIFWNEYPRKVGKKEAFRAFKKANMPVQVLLSAVREQKQSAMWTKEGGRYIPNPATWLNQGRWDDKPVKLDTKTKDSDGFYTLNNGVKTGNQWLPFLEEELNEQSRNNTDSGNSELCVP